MLGKTNLSPLSGNNPNGALFFYNDLCQQQIGSGKENDEKGLNGKGNHEKYS